MAIFAGHQPASFQRPGPQHHDRSGKIHQESSCQCTHHLIKIIAAICCIELPRNGWPGIIEKISQNINNSDPTVKEVSILTIGFICEQIKEFNCSLEEGQQETILTGILMAVKDSHPDIVETAFKALRDGMPAMSDVMKNIKAR